MAKAAIPEWKALAPLVIAGIIALLPVPSGLAPHAWYFSSIFVDVIVGLDLEPLPGAPIALMGITLTAVLGGFAPRRWSLGYSGCQICLHLGWKGYEKDVGFANLENALSVSHFSHSLYDG